MVTHAGVGGGSREEWEKEKRACELLMEPQNEAH